MGLVLIPSTGHDHGQVVAGMIGGVAEIASHDHGRVIEKSPSSFLNLIQFKKEIVKMPTTDKEKLFIDLVCAAFKYGKLFFEN